MEDLTKEIKGLLGELSGDIVSCSGTPIDKWRETGEAEIVCPSKRNKNLSYEIKLSPRSISVTETIDVKLEVKP